MAKKAINRAPGKTQISISLPESLVRQIDALAAGENRNRSNYIANSLQRLADEAAYITGDGSGKALPPVSKAERTAPARRR